MSKIVVSLPEDRWKAGVLSVVASNGIVVAKYAALGKSTDKIARKYNNKDRDRLRIGGDTPYGTYEFDYVQPTGNATLLNEHSYGPNGAIVMTPSGGEAKEAYDAYGREKIWIHGGDTKVNGDLKATAGCIRLYNEDMQELIDLIEILSAFDDPINSCTVERGLEISIIPSSAEEDTTESDPPPRIGTSANGNAHPPRRITPSNPSRNGGQHSGGDGPRAPASGSGNRPPIPSEARHRPRPQPPPSPRPDESPRQPVPQRPSDRPRKIGRPTVTLNPRTRL
jgi:L,D-transpeptidase catalytic domain